MSPVGKIICACMLFSAASVPALGQNVAISRAAFLDVQGKAVKAVKLGKEVILEVNVTGIDKTDAVTRVVAQFNVTYVSLLPPPPPPPPPPSGTAATPIKPQCEEGPSPHPEEHQVVPHPDQGGYLQVISVKQASIKPERSSVVIRIPLTVGTYVSTCKMPQGQSMELTLDAIRMDSNSWTASKIAKPARDITIPLSASSSPQKPSR